MTPTGWARAAALVAQRDLTVQWRTAGRLSGLGAFAGSVLLLLSLVAGPATRGRAEPAAAMLWLTLLLASTLGLGAAMAEEQENQALAGALLAGVPAGALFVGKALGQALVLMVLGLAAAPVAIALFAVEVAGLGGWARALAAGLAGSLAVGAPGTLVAALTARARGRESLLPWIMLPLVLPVLLAATRASSAAWAGDPMGHYAAWMWLLVAFNAVYWPLCAVLSHAVLEEGA